MAKVKEVEEVMEKVEGEIIEKNDVPELPEEKKPNWFQRRSAKKLERESAYHADMVALAVKRSNGELNAIQYNVEKTKRYAKHHIKPIAAVGIGIGIGVYGLVTGQNSDISQAREITETSDECQE